MLKNGKQRIAAVIGGLVLGASGLAVTASTVTADSAQAATCYGGAEYFYKRSGVHSIPNGSGWWKTTSRCNDINLKPASWVSSGRNVKVCFNPSSGNVYCQRQYTYVPAGSGWKVIASNVGDGTKYRFQFQTTGSWGGYRAN